MSQEADQGSRATPPSAFDLARHGYRLARKVIIGVVGGTLLLVGGVLVFTPGPALVVIPLGLGVLALEFAWARHWLRRLRRMVEASTSSTSRPDDSDDPSEPSCDSTSESADSADSAFGRAGRG